MIETFTVNFIGFDELIIQDKKNSSENNWSEYLEHMQYAYVDRPHGYPEEINAAAKFLLGSEDCVSYDDYFTECKIHLLSGNSFKQTILWFQCQENGEFP